MSKIESDGLFETEPIEKRKKFYLHDCDITFDREITLEEAQRLYAEALHNVGVIGRRGTVS